jgi:exopolyphosphatase/guanosine-5'-triphosphate,3'-diphosphate pyrophosphatase
VSKHYAVISIGTNSTRVLLADMAPEHPHVDLALSIGTRIGEGLGDRGTLGEEPVRRTLEAIRSHHKAVRGHYLRLFAIATSAVRRAQNGAEFKTLVQEMLRVPLHVLSGDEEATASYRGAITVLDSTPGTHFGVIDTGGGSTEYAVGDSHNPEKTASCEIGAVRLTEMIPELAGHGGAVDLKTIERARAIAREALAPIADFPEVQRLAFVGGSATTAAAVIRAKRGPISEFEISRTNLQRALVRLLGMTYDERKNVIGMKAQRADILPGGMIVLDTVLEMLNHDSATATSSDLLLGYLLQQRDAAPIVQHVYPHDSRLARLP